MKDASPEKILERLMQATNAKTEAALAAAIGISHQAVYNARNKGSVPSSWVLEIAKKFDISADWLFFGTELINDKPPVPQTSPPQPVPGSNAWTVSCGGEEVTLIPRVEARLSAGGGSFETSADIEGHYAFRSDWIRRKGSVKEMVLMRVAGDSMLPIIADGDMVLVDQAQTDLRPGKLYAVAIEDMIYLKKLDALPGKLILTSFNDVYPPVEVDMREQLGDTVKVIGRALWWCHET